MAYYSVVFSSMKSMKQNLRSRSEIKGMQPLNVELLRFGMGLYR